MNRLNKLFLFIFINLTAAASVAAQTNVFKVPGSSGRNWINTKIDVEPGTLIGIRAEGEVFYGDGSGVFGPDGTAKLGFARTFPSEGKYRYGLAARISGSVQNPEDDLREDYHYSEQREICARSRGRLYLTANDDQPADNKGEYEVYIKLGKCRSQPEEQDKGQKSGSGTFRLKIIGFRVERVVHDGLLDAGDDAYIVWDAAEFNADGRFAGRGLMSGQSAVYGDANRRRTQVGIRTRNQGGGGFRNNEEIIGTLSQPGTNQFPLLIGDFELRDGESAVVFVPTVWIAKNEPGNLLQTYRSRMQNALRLVSFDTRELIERRSDEWQMMSSSTRSAADWFDWLVPLYMGTDRPIGVSGTAMGLQTLRGDYPAASFVPNVYALTYHSVTSLLRRNNVNINNSPVRFEANYAGSGVPGSYRIIMTVERIL